MKLGALLFTMSVLLVPVALQAQDDSVAMTSIRKFRQELDAEYRNPAKSPLNDEKLRAFTGHSFFPVDLNFRVEAMLTVTDKEPFFKMATSDNRTRNYRQYGIVEFAVQGKTFKLAVYQSQRLMGTEEYADYLFFPFTDLTNGVSSYEAGRYIDLRIPETGNKIIIDFNQAYNPFCAYSDRYSCPVVPEKNHLDIDVKAGVSFPGKH